MSSFWGIAKHPKTGRWSECMFVDDALGPHHYGVQFRRENEIYDANKVVDVDKAGYRLIYNAFIRWTDIYTRWHSNDLAAAEFLNEMDTTYELEFDGHDITVTVGADGNITARPNNNKQMFNFTASDPEVVEAMAACLAEAARLGAEQEKLNEDDTDGGKEN